MIEQTQWYKILFKDGRINYATKRYDLYFLGGYGFGHTDFDAVITPMEGYPPSDDIHTYVCFDSDTMNVFRAIIDKNSRWNGWECPYIHIDDVQKLLDYLCKPELECYKYKWDGNDILLTDSYDDNHESRIEPSIIDGETYYFFGGEGFTFEQARLQHEDKSEL
jgi:hypothetical protein